MLVRLGLWFLGLVAFSYWQFQAVLSFYLLLPLQLVLWLRFKLVNLFWSSALCTTCLKRVGLQRHRNSGEGVNHDCISPDWYFGSSCTDWSLESPELLTRHPEITERHYRSHMVDKRIASDSQYEVCCWDPAFCRYRIVVLGARPEQRLNRNTKDFEFFLTIPIMHGFA